MLEQAKNEPAHDDEQAPIFAKSQHPSRYSVVKLCLISKAVG